MSFTHLQVRSGYSLFQSTMTINTLVERAQQLELTNLALTDEQVLYGAIPFYQACENAGIKPILGMNIFYPVEQETNIPCILLAKNNHGYQQLIQISTHIQLEEEWDISAYAEDVIAIISTETLPLQKFIREERFHDLVEWISPFARHFGEGDFYLGIETYEGLTDSMHLQALQNFSQTAPFAFTALHDVRYAQASDVTSYDCLQAMKQNKKWNKTNQSNKLVGKHLRSKREMINAFSEWPSLLDTTNEIADKCHVTFSFTQQRLPKFPVPVDSSSHEYLRYLCQEQVGQKFSIDKKKQVEERLHYELNVIQQLDFSDYFLIVADFVNFAKSEGIAVGPGRGSAAGSIVAFLLGITDVDPLHYDLLFERFLNPERVSMPDIDIDFSDNRRDEVIDYVRNKYGEDHVAQIITFGTFAARSLIRELMKTMEIDHRDQAYILQHIPVQGNESLLAYIQKSDEFQLYIKRSPKLRTLFSIAITLEGLPRHISTHAAGIVIGQQPLIKDVPLTKGSHDTYLTQYAMNELESIGLLKIDMLGLRNLTLMERIVTSIERGIGEKINMDTIPIDDATTFELLQAGRTNGVFQLESAGMKNVLTSLRPTSLDDIIAVNALYRPGPMEQIPVYIRRKHQEERVNYLHPDLEPILHSTYGVLIYQEQIMQIAHRFAGLSLGEADILRRAISKKDRQLIDEQKQTFVQGCLQKGYEQTIVENLFSWIIKFANYGFNKSHSVAYSKIAYQLSYLKAHYPTYFFAHLLSTVSNDANKLHMYIREAKAAHIRVLPPSINHSLAYYTVEGKDIRIGLMAIKGIGFETIKEIIAGRKDSLYTDLFDFCIRNKTIKRNALETLIIAGAFDETLPNRASLLASIDQALDHAELFSGMDGQGTLLTEKMNMRPSYIDMEDFTAIQKLADEKELLNMYISSHPIQQYRTTLTRRSVSTIEKATNAKDNNVVKIVGIVQTCRKIRTKRGESMSFMTISDETGEMDCVIFPNVFREVNHWLEEEQIICIQGRVSTRQNQKQIIINDMDKYDLQASPTVNEQKQLYIRIKETKVVTDVLTYLQSLAKKHPGRIEIIIYNELEKKTYKLEEHYCLSIDETVLDHLNKYFGIENVVLKQ